MELSWEQQLEELLQQANRLRSAADHSAAARLLDAAPEVVKAFGLWRFVRGTVALEAGDLKTAVIELELAVQRDPKVPEFRGVLATALLEKGRTGDHFALRRARQLLEELSVAEPKSASAQSALGSARFALNETDAALVCFDRALKLDPKHVASLFYRGAALKKLGRTKEAVVMLEKVLKLDPKHAAALEAKQGLKA